MPFEMIHFRDSDKIIRKKKLDRDVKATLEYVYDALQGVFTGGSCCVRRSMKWDGGQTVP